MRLFSRVFLPFLLVIYIGTETYLKLQHTSLCEKVGCRLAGELLRFNPIYLNYFGLISVLALFVLGYYSLKSTKFEMLFFTILYAAIAFETTILSYQLIVNPEACLFCLGVFSSLLLIAFFTHMKYFTLIVVIILSILLGLVTLAIPQNKSFITAPGLYLIQSESCSHCKKVKAYFAENHIAYTAIPSKEINAKAFLKFVDIHTIPVLVIKEASGFTLFTGDKNIIAHFEAQKKNEAVAPEATVVPVQSSTLDFSSDFLGTGQNDECAITVSETSSCEEHNTTPLPQQ